MARHGPAPTPVVGLDLRALVGTRPRWLTRIIGHHLRGRPGRLRVLGGVTGGCRVGRTLQVCHDELFEAHRVGLPVGMRPGRQGAGPVRSSTVECRSLSVRWTGMPGRSASAVALGTVSSWCSEIRSSTGPAICTCPRVRTTSQSQSRSSSDTTWAVDHETFSFRTSRRTTAISAVTASSLSPAASASRNHRSRDARSFSCASGGAGAGAAVMNVP
jgi:hypothetical protein